LQKGSYSFTVEANDHANIDEAFMASIEDGVIPYSEYLRAGVATDINIKSINSAGQKIIIDNVGGSMFRTVPRIFEKLGINNAKFK